VSVPESADDKRRVGGRAGLSASGVARVAAVLPAVLFPVTYLVAATGGHVDWCVPPLQGCTDITHTGLRFPESHIFRVAMPFVCLLFVLVWLIAYDWVRQARGEAGIRERRFRSLGVAAALALLIGEMVLQGKDTIWSIHGLGAILFFVLTYAALVIHSRSISDLALVLPDSVSPLPLRVKRLIVRLLTVVLVAAVAAKLFHWREGGRIAQWVSTYAILAYVWTLSSDWQGYRLVLVGLTKESSGASETD
jgi:hypothetical protein